MNQRRGGNKGLIGMIAKGCKSPKSMLRSCTDKLTYGKFYIKYKENKLSILNNFDSYSNFKNIKSDFNKLGFTMYLLNLSYQVAKENFNENGKKATNQFFSIFSKHFA